jgi:hypothetical protein
MEFNSSQVYFVDLLAAVEILIPKVRESEARTVFKGLLCIYLIARLVAIIFF